MASSDIEIFAAFAVIFGGLLILATKAAVPIRQRMLAASIELYNDRNATAESRSRIDFMLDTAASPLPALLMILAGMITVVDCLFFGGPSENDTDELRHDGRYRQFVRDYFKSIILANPIAAIALVPLMLICSVVINGKKDSRREQVADAQITRLSHSMAARA